MHSYKPGDMASRSHITFAKHRTFPLVSSAQLSQRLPHPPQWAIDTVLRSTACLLMLAMSLLFGSSIAFAGSSSNALVVSPTSLNQSSTQCTADGSPTYTYHCTVSLGASATSHGKISWTSKSSLSGVAFTPASGSLKSGQTISVKIASIPCQAGGTSGSFTFSGSKGTAPATATWSCTPPPPTFTVSPGSLDPTNANCALDAPLSSTYKCTVTLGETSGSQGNANWSASISLNGVTFTPASATLNPGGSASVAIDLIPCQNGTFTFKGAEGETPVSVAWSCTPPTLRVSPTTLNNGMCADSGNASQCTVTLSETATSQGNVNWAASSDLSGVSFNPSTSTLSPGNSATVTISAIPCQNDTFTFKGSGGASPVSVAWKCANWTQFGYDPQHTHFNPNEDGLSTSNVSGLIVDWKTPMGAIGYSSPVVVNNISYIGSEDGFLYALNVANGAVVWKDYVASPTSPAKANSIVYIGSQDHNYGYAGLYALDTQTGALLWKNLSDFFGPPTVVNGIVYAEGDSGFSAFDATSGALKWTFPISGSDTIGSPAMDNGVVYFGSVNGNIYALDATTGALKWSYNPNSYPINSTPIVANGAVYVTVSNGEVIALNASTGAPLWTFGFFNRNGIASPALANGVVYVSIGGAPDQLYAFDATTGAVLWQTAVSNSQSTPAVANGVIYTGSSDHNVYAFDASKGTKLWSFTTGYQIPSSPAVVNGVVYIGSSDGNMYAFHLPGTNAKLTAKHR